MTTICACIVNPLFLDTCFTMRIQPGKFNDIFCGFYVTQQETEMPLRYAFEYSMKFYRCINTKNNTYTNKQALMSYKHFIGCQIFATFQASYGVQLRGFGSLCILRGVGWYLVRLPTSVTKYQTTPRNIPEDRRPFPYLP
jgi:hypothetical protein